MCAIARSSMLSGLIILIGATVAQRKGCFKLRLIVILITLVFASYGSLINMEQLNFTQGLERIERRGSTDQWDEVNSEYLSNLATYPSYIIFGALLEEMSSINEVEGNPHNAYILLHTVFGLFGVLIFVCLIIIAAFRLIKYKMKLTANVLLVAIFRSASDSTAFHESLGVVIFYCIFCALKNINFNFDFPGKKYELCNEH